MNAYNVYNVRMASTLSRRTLQTHSSKNKNGSVRAQRREKRQRDPPSHPPLQQPSENTNRVHLERKVDAVSRLLKPVLQNTPMTVFASPPSHFRYKVGCGVFRASDGSLSYSMIDPEKRNSVSLTQESPSYYYIFLLLLLFIYFLF